jgi:hypothetical protein
MVGDPARPAPGVGRATHHTVVTRLACAVRGGQRTVIRSTRL